jgi:hypothetical protein
MGQDVRSDVCSTTGLSAWTYGFAPLAMMLQV